MIAKRFFDEFESAYTLNPEEVCENHDEQTGMSTRVHADGWTISGEICEDWFYWVNAFEAHHPVYGRVWGNFEDTVYAGSEEGLLAFKAAHPPKAWDYQDI